MKRRAKKEEFVTEEIKGLPFHVQTQIWARWRYSPAFYKQSFEDYREAFCLDAIAADVWHKSHKTIVAGTDGSIRLELA